jgi:ribonuclease R
VSGRTVPFPTPEQIAAFVSESETPPTLREITRAFQLHRDDRDRVREIVRALEAQGRIPGKRRRSRGPAEDTDVRVAVVLIESVDTEGVAQGRPVRWPGDALPTITIEPGKGPALGRGDRVLARITAESDGLVGRVMRRLDPLVARTIVGVLRRGGRGHFRIEPVDRREREDWPVEGPLPPGVADGDLVVADAVLDPSTQRRNAAVTERIGDADAPGAIGLIAIHAAGIPVAFPTAALAQAEAAQPAGLAGRVDLRALPLVTIDGEDARDFDDAVFAEPDADGGWHLVVAIADVAHYVTPGSPLDRAARERGNSVYLPDRVVPMLPEALSNGLCSLKPAEDRACLAAHLWIDATGRLRRHRFERGLMCSRARLTYNQVQAARNGAPDAATAPLMDMVIGPLYGAFTALDRARRKRGTLELDIPERVVRLDAEGRVREIGVRPRLDSHRLIEEFMIAANVAAAETLEGKQAPTLYRVHDQPDRARLEALREALAPLGYRIAAGTAPLPSAFSGVLDRARGRPEEAMVSEMILRAQAQAAYSPRNIGHYGLALPRYAHFTSPIRRYADLIVHRGLIRLLRLGGDGMTDADSAELDAIGEHISWTERRAAGAERDAVDRYAAAWLSDRTGETFAGRISGVARFGLFVSVADGAASGLVPIESLPDDFYEHDAAHEALVGRRWGRVFRLGAPVRARLLSVDPVAARVTFSLVDARDGADLPGFATPRPGRAPRGRRRG